MLGIAPSSGSSCKRRFLVLAAAGAPIVLRNIALERSILVQPEWN